MEHDIIHDMFNGKNSIDYFREYLGTITIGNNCVIAAESVITHDITDNSIVDGCWQKLLAI